MSKEMIISVNGREKKIAILDNGQVTEFYIERDEDNSGVVGNIYKGKVQRVLPGMQSAFVDIGLDRDAFLYVSDFFDEEEEIERIVIEKSREKRTKDEAEIEATDEIQKKRLKRDKKIDVAQEKAEIGDGEIDIDNFVEEVEEEEEEEEEEQTKPKRGRRARNVESKESKPAKRGRDAKHEELDFESETEDEVVVPIAERENVLEAIDLNFDVSDFERIVDEDGDTGEMLKDAMMQEAITDKVRAIEFDMESTDSAEVGSLLSSLSFDRDNFERIADEDDESSTEKPATKRTRSTRKRTSSARKTKTAKEKESEAKEDSEEKPKKTGRGASKRTSRAGAKAGSGKTSRGRKKASEEVIPDAEASITEASETPEMAVRRGSRGGRRRSSKPRESNSGTDSDTHMDKAYKSTEHDEPVIAEHEVADAEFQSKRPRSRGRYAEKKQAKITDLLREGQEVVVQIAKEPIAKKGARITSHIAMPGRYLVYMPTIEHLGVSRKIPSSKERSRLRSLLQDVVSKGKITSGGFIVRTAGVGKSEEDLAADANYLVNTWKDIKRNSEKTKAPTLVHQDLDIILRLLRDHLSDDFTAIRVDSEEEYLRIVEFVNRIQPKLVKRVKFYTLDQPILDAYGVSDEIDKALKHRVWLKSGGYLVINQTEALIAIDVNTGKFVGKGNARLEDTITKTNLEAVDEIARQIRLRDLGGIIVLDLIDMEDRRNRNKVQQALQEALSRDKSPTKVLSFNDFGLIIMTRKRVKQSLERTLCAPCSYCDGAGWVKSPQTVCYEILDEARRISKELSDVRQTTLRVHPEVSKALRDTEREVFFEIEEYLGTVDLTDDPTIHQEQFDFAFI
ncbi:MAG: Rne/Rng family ribonuclease [Pyrinomonadaceae bacterium]